MEGDIGELDRFDQAILRVLATDGRVSAKLAGLWSVSHLIRVEPITLARLRVLSVLPPPRTAPYLVAIH